MGEWINEPFDIEIADGVACLKYPCGKQTVVPLRVMRIMRERVDIALGAHDRHCAEVRRLRE